MKLQETKEKKAFFDQSFQPAEWARFFGEDKLIYSSSKNSTGNDLYEWTDEPFLDLFVSNIDSLGDLGEPNKISGDINTPFHESSAILSRDKKTMYFTRNNFYKGDLSFDKNKQVNLKIYKAQSEDGETWTNVQAWTCVQIWRCA